MKNKIIYLVAWVIAGIALLIGLYQIFPAFAGFGEAMAYWSMAVAAFISYDIVVLKEIDTIEELKKGNVAYAISLVAVALLFVGIAILVG